MVAKVCMVVSLAELPTIHGAPSGLAISNGMFCVREKTLAIIFAWNPMPVSSWRLYMGLLWHECTWKRLERHRKHKMVQSSGEPRATASVRATILVKATRSDFTYIPFSDFYWFFIRIKLLNKRKLKTITWNSYFCSCVHKLRKGSQKEKKRKHV